MWTIAYEFRCYLGAAILGVLGCYREKARIIVVALGASFVILNLSRYFADLSIKDDWAFGSAAANVRFAAAFAVGQAYYLFRARIRYTHLGALLALAGLVGMLFNARLAESAFMCLGGYLIFWFAFKFPVLAVSKADNKADISYGVYLYAWPIQNLIIWSNPSIMPWKLCLVTLAAASSLGLASWILIEKPSLALLRGNRRLRSLIGSRT